jgi:hypothetical protein
MCRLLVLGFLTTLGLGGEKRFSRLYLEDSATNPRSLTLALQVFENPIKEGSVPSLRLTIQNRGKIAQKVLDISGGRRVDLQHTYYDIEVIKDGKVVHLPRAISDPGPILDADYVALKPNAKITFDLTDFPVALDKLPVGKYKVRVLFWQDPFESHKKRCPSPDAEFTVSKKK